VAEAPSFAEALRAIAGGLRESDPTHDHLNLAAVRIDQLGRRLHGLGFARDREIADAFTAAVGELAEAHLLPDEERGEGVRRAAAHLEAAAAHAEQGLLPAA
jgi:hypothetical protein